MTGRYESKSRQAGLHEQEAWKQYVQGKVVAANEETDARKEEEGPAEEGQWLSSTVWM